MVWKKAAEILIDGKVPLTIYHSNRSKLRVLVAETPWPIVDGRLTFDKLSIIRDHFFEKTVADHRFEDAFNNIGPTIDEYIQFFHLRCESWSTSLIGEAIVGHQLYGQESDPDYKVMEQYLNEADLLREFKSKPASFWHLLFHKYITNRNYVCVIAEPSERMAQEIAAEENARIITRINQIGGGGLDYYRRKLEAAIKRNSDHQPTDDDLKKFIVRDLEKFNMIEVNTSTNLPPNSSGFVCNFPFTAFWHGVRSDFVDVNILIDTDGLPVEDRLWLMLWFKLMFQSPAVVEGEEISYEEVAKLSSRDLVSNSASVGVSGIYDQFMSLRLRAYSEKVGNLSKWANIYLKGIKFYPERVAICARNLANNAAGSKQNASSMCQLLANSTYSDSNTRFYSYLGLEKFHKAVAKAVADGKSDAVLARLEAVRQKVLASPLNVHFSGDMSHIQREGSSADVATQWGFIGRQKRALLQCSADHGASMKQHYGTTVAIRVYSAESFLLQKTRFYDDWTGITTMPTLLLAHYFSQTEGPLWRALRGHGRAYSIRICLSPDQNCLSLRIDQFAHLGQAYEIVRYTVVTTLEDGQLDENLLEAAKRSLVCELISGQSTVKLTATSAILATIRSVGNDFTRKLCKQIWHAEASDVLRIGGPALRRLFDPSQSVRSIALNASRQKELNEFLPNINRVDFPQLQANGPNV